MNVGAVCLLLGLVALPQVLRGQIRYKEASELVRQCASAADVTYCDAALALLTKEAATPEATLLAGMAQYHLFILEQDAAFSKAFVTIGEEYFTPSLAYQFMGQEKRTLLVVQAQAALANLKNGVRNKEGSLMMKELESYLEQMALR
jgi:hypothetical protein